MPNNPQPRQSFFLKKLSVTDSRDVYNMLQNIPAEERFGYKNDFNGMTFVEFKKALVKREQESKGINLEEDRVPQTIFWFYVDRKPVGLVKIRHYLNQRLK